MRATSYLCEIDIHAVEQAVTTAGLCRAHSLGRWRVEEARREQTDLLREIIGNPFRSVAIDPAWLAWKDATVRNLAEAVYEERAFTDLPVLADALEEAGCTNQDIVNHCRGPGPHLRGCWVVDLVLGKQ